MAGRVLVVDDEFPIRRLLRNTLERAGYTVAEAASGRDALAAMPSEPDAVLLDLGLPDREGLELVPLMRARSEAVILVVSARDATDQKVAALDLGADDYVTKPFDGEELLARLRVALRHRRGRPAPAAVLRASGGIEIDVERRRVQRDGVEVHLTRKEYDILTLLARHAGRIVTHDRMLAAAWGADADARIEYLRIVVRNLRQKLEAPGPVGSLIANELGVGYRLRAPAEAGG